ncbi:hypothetical protein P3S67_011113 [Capsicum chacoense]
MAFFPDNNYGVDSAGDPQVIPSLSFEEFKGAIIISSAFQAILGYSGLMSVLVSLFQDCHLENSNSKAV